LLGEELYQTGIKLEMKNFMECQLNHLKSGNFFGDKNLPALTTIDTPGFLDNVEQLNSSGALLPCFQMFVKDLIVRGPNVFILAINIEEYTRTDFSFLKEIGLIFGKEFWDHLVVVLTHCEGDSWKDEKENVILKLKEEFSTVKQLTKDSFEKHSEKKYEINERFPEVIFMSNQEKEGIQLVYEAIKNMPKYESEVMKKVEAMLNDEKISDEEIDSYILMEFFQLPKDFQIDFSQMCNIL
jgi:hypothetical protein